jgi:nitrate/TMAO reductase-like tetraheme cytochrome c subunit
MSEEPRKPSESRPDKDAETAGPGAGDGNAPEAPAPDRQDPPADKHDASASSASEAPVRRRLSTLPPVPPTAWSRVFQDASNAITVVGAMITSASAVLFLTYFLVDVLWGFHSTYVSLIVYLLLPAGFVFGLFLIPTGIWRTRVRRARHKLDRPLDPYPVIDFNDRHVRVTWTVVILVTIINVAILGIATYKGLEYTDSVEFCGSLCHTVMNPQRVSHADSPHARVPCVDCHIGAGAGWFVRSKMSGLRQVWAVFAGTYSTPIPTPVENLRPARETCEACHWPQKFYGDRLVLRTHYAPDETNTRTQTSLLIKTGGGDPRLGMHGGIHWYHMERQHEIRFIPGDPRQQSVAWIRYRTPEGETFEFTNRRVPREPGAEPRVMDCVTCHNQPTHGFRLPGAALDDALAHGLIDPTLPFIKREALTVLSAPFQSETEARTRLEEAILGFYNLTYPELARTRADDIARSIRAIGDVWARNVFPDMKITWGTYPNNTGHPHAVAVPDDHEGRANDSCTMCHSTNAGDPGGTPTIPHAATAETDCLSCHSPYVAADRGFPGCFRCHNEGMQMSAGPRTIAIATDCNSCHFMSFLGKGDLVVPRSFLGNP